MERSEQINEIAAALAKSQMQFGPLIADQLAKVKTKAGIEYSYNYADLADALEVCRPVIAANGIAVVQDPCTVEHGVEIVTWLFHASGQWLCSRPLWLSFQGGPQEMGSVVSYLRRYQLLAMLGLAPEDDDGAKAQALAHGKKSGSKGGGAPPRNAGAAKKWTAGIRVWGELGVRPDALLEHLGRSSDTEVTDADNDRLEQLFIDYREGEAKAVAAVEKMKGSSQS